VCVNCMLIRDEKNPNSGLRLSSGSLMMRVWFCPGSEYFKNRFVLGSSSVNMRFGCSSVCIFLSMELVRCFHGSRLLRIDCNCN